MVRLFCTCFLFDNVLYITCRMNTFACIHTTGDSRVPGLGHQVYVIVNISTSYTYLVPAHLITTLMSHWNREHFLTSTFLPHDKTQIRVEEGFPPSRKVVYMMHRSNYDRMFFLLSSMTFSGFEPRACGLQAQCSNH